VKTNEIIDVPVDTCFMFIGYLPNTEIFKGMVDMNRGGYVITNEKMETNIPGVYCAGDVRDKFLKQVATAVGDGAIAGYAVEKYIAESEVFENQIMDASQTGLVYIFNAVDPAARELLPVIEGFEEKYMGKVKVTKVDIYKSEGIANRLGVKTSPCVVAIKGGKQAGVLTENITEESLKALAGI
ncbi:MAG: FAD-dependent oxidoreductase, partial [Angelakisella sp.]